MNPTLHVHAVRAVLAMCELELVGHVIHVVEIVVPTVVEYVPAVQSLHAALSVVILYFPEAQAVHMSSSGPVNPMLQVQEAPTVHPLHEAPELVGHATHVVATVAPAVSEYVSAPQLVHTPAPDTPEYVQAMQFVHTADEMSPTAIEYEPAAQFVHCPEPVVVLYLPVAQVVHVLPAGYTGRAHPASHTQSSTDPLVPNVCEYGGHKLQFALPSGDHCPTGHTLHVWSPVAL